MRTEPRTYGVSIRPRSSGYSTSEGLELAVARAGLAGGAPVGRAVHERIPAHRGATPLTRLALLRVRLQRAIEVAARAVDVDIERIERRAALLERLVHDLRDVAQQRLDLAGLEVLCVTRIVQRRAPQRLIGIDVASPNLNDGMLQ